MKEIPRHIAKDILEELGKVHSKIIVIYGARQVGKTTLVQHILEESDIKFLKLNGDSISQREMDILTGRDVETFKQLLSGYGGVFLDEGQRIHNIGINLKILYETLPELKIIVTGSSSLDLANSIKEPLTGRTDTYHLHPISYLELRSTMTPYELDKQLECQLVYGGYPEIYSVQNASRKKKLLTSLAGDYLYKDVLEFENILHHYKLRNLLKLLAFQVGSEVSYHELGQQLSLSHSTVVNYIDLLEKAFVIITLRGFSRNLRKEVTKKPKIYFCDLGIRNALIGNFNDLKDRNDIGVLWENFIVMERIKKNTYLNNFCDMYFWRTYTGAELDYIEESSGTLHGYEFKWQKKGKVPKTWVETYEGSYDCFNRNNYMSFIT